MFETITSYIAKDDIIFMVKAGEMTAEHLVKVIDIEIDNGKNAVTAEKSMTLLKVPSQTGVGMDVIPVPGFGINSNNPAFEGGKPSLLYINLDNFDAVGIVKDKEIIDLFNSYTSGIVAVGGSSMQPTRKSPIIGA